MGVAHWAPLSISVVYDPICMKFGEHIRLGLIRQSKVTKLNFTAWNLNCQNWMAWKLYWALGIWNVLFKMKNLSTFGGLYDPPFKICMQKKA